MAEDTIDRLALEFLGAFGLPPVEYVELASRLGCRRVSLPVSYAFANPHGYAPWSLLEDRALRADTARALDDYGVTISLGGGFYVTPRSDVRDRAADLEVLRELGATRINTVSMDPDLGRSFDQFAILAEMAAAAGLETITEFAPSLAVRDLPTALAAVRHVGRDDFTLLIDALHLVRSGASPADLAALDPAVIGYFQICDAPLAPAPGEYSQESNNRLAPGQGGLPLAEMLAAIPEDVIVGLETPSLAEAERGVGAYERLAPCVAGARALLAKA